MLVFKYQSINEKSRRDDTLLTVGETYGRSETLCPIGDITYTHPMTTSFSPYFTELNNLSSSEYPQSSNLITSFFYAIVQESSNKVMRLMFVCNYLLLRLFCRLNEVEMRFCNTSVIGQAVPDQLQNSKYKLYLPTEEELRAEIERQKEIFMLQQAGKGGYDG